MLNNVKKLLDSVGFEHLLERAKDNSLKNKDKPLKRELIQKRYATFDHVTKI